jgi:NADH dehydrogenase FAD-containing subunit
MTNTRVTGVEEDAATGRTTIRLRGSGSVRDGDLLEADLYLPFHGVSVNTGFVPGEMLDSAGNLNLGPDMRVAGTSNMWGIGDVGNLEAKQLTVTDAQIIHLASALDGVLTASGRAAHPAIYKPDGKTMLFVSLGRRRATGQIGNWRLPGCMVSWVKGRRLFADTARGYVGGQHLRHAKM